jgi:hypothetical protein
MITFEAKAEQGGRSSSIRYTVRNYRRRYNDIDLNYLALNKLMSILDVKYGISKDERNNIYSFLNNKPLKYFNIDILADAIYVLQISHKRISSENINELAKRKGLSEDEINKYKMSLLKYIRYYLKIS